jgi:hypothetical protein
MGIFSSIKDAIFGKAAAQPAPTRAPAPGATRTAAPASRPAAAPTAISEVDVEARLDAMQGADSLNWRTSIADLMKLVGLDASYENRKELATELGDKDYSGKAEENIWLHRQVMNRLAANGGRVPASLRD